MKCDKDQLYLGIIWPNECKNEVIKHSYLRPSFEALSETAVGLRIESFHPHTASCSFDKQTLLSLEPSMSLSIC